MFQLSRPGLGGSRSACKLCMPCSLQHLQHLQWLTAALLHASTPCPPPDRSHAFTRVAPEIERLFESVARRWGCCLALACSACACGCGCLHGCGAQSLARPLGGIDHVTSFPTLIPAILLSPHPLQLHGPPGGAGGRCGRRQGGRATGGCGVAHRTAASAGAVSFELLDPGRACGGAAARGG